MYVEVRQSESVLGPYVIPRRAGCWECGVLRQAANAGSVTHEVARIRAQRHVATSRPSKANVAIATLMAEASTWYALNITTSEDEALASGCLLFIDNATLRVHRSRLVPIPDCRTCGGPISTIERVRGVTPALRTEGSRLHGSVPLSLAGDRRHRRRAYRYRDTESLKLPAADELPSLAYASARGGSFSDGVHVSALKVVGHCLAANVQHAVSAALGEALERYSAGF